MVSVVPLCLLLAWLHSVGGLLVPRAGLRIANHPVRDRPRCRYAQVGPATEAQAEPVSFAQIDKRNITQLATFVAGALISGDTAKLQTSGIDVLDMAIDCNSLEEKLSDPEVQAKVFGDVECDPEMASRLAMATLSASSAPVRRRAGGGAEMDVVIDDVDETLLARMRTGVTLDSIESGFIHGVESISSSKGKNMRMTSDQRSEQVDPSGALAKGNTEVVFTELLKATIAEQERSAGEDEALAAASVSSVQRADFSVADLDMRAILGEAMHSIAESLGIDVQQEVAGPKLQSIVKKTARELGADLQQLSAESDRLQAALRSIATTPVIPPSAGTAASAGSAPVSSLAIPVVDTEPEIIDATSINETALLQSSMEAMRASTARMQSVLGDLNENADLLTTLVMFPLRSADKKAAFVLGLALLLKVPFDVLSMWAVRDMGNAQEWAVLAAQLALGVACFQHFGLWRALLISYSDKYKT